MAKIKCRVQPQSAARKRNTSPEEIGEACKVGGDSISLFQCFPGWPIVLHISGCAILVADEEELDSVYLGCHVLSSILCTGDGSCDVCVRGDEVSSLAAASGGLVTCTLDHIRFVEQHWVGI